MAAEWGTEMAQSTPPAQSSSAGREPFSSCPLGAGGFTPRNGCWHSHPCTPWLLVFEKHSWAEVDEYFLPDPSLQEQSQPDLEHHFASDLTCAGGDLQSSAGRFFGLRQRKRAFTNKTLPLPN